jgi:hypothetical protein
MYISKKFNSGANPTIISYNTNAVKFCNAKSSLVHFENIFFLSKNALAHSNAGIVCM